MGRYTTKPFNEKRTLIGSYKGYPIFEERVKDFKPCNNAYDSTNVVCEYTRYYCCIKNGNINRSSDIYDYCCLTKKEIKEVINRIEGGEIILTEKEYNDWVRKPNNKNDWGFNTKMLLNLMRAYKKASPRRRVGYLKRLEDANFHTECSLLEEENYVEFERFAKEL